MSSSHAHRILAISITVALCVPTTSGFTLQRTQLAAVASQEYKADPSLQSISADLNSQESVLLQVKDISKGPNAINNVNDHNTKVNVESKQTNEAATILTTITTSVYDNESSSVTPEVSITDIKLPNIFETTMLEKVYGQYTEITNATEIFAPNNKVKNTTPDNVIGVITTEIPTETTVISINTDQVAIDTETTENLSTGRDNNMSDTQINLTTQASNVEDTTNTSIEPISDIVEIINVSENQSLNYGLSNSNIETQTSTDEPQTTSDMNDSEQITTTETSWKKYVIIDRKRTSSEDLATESTVNDYFYVNPTNIAPLTVPPPKRIDLLPENNEQITNTASNQDIATIEKKNSFNDKIVSSLKIDDNRLINNSIDTKRAGFLDYSKTSPYDTITATTEQNNESNEPHSVFNEPLSTKTISQSHSDLSDDAIKEELLREEVMYNAKQNQENIRQIDDYHVESTVDPNEATSNLSTISAERNNVIGHMDITPLQSPTSTEDTLSVQPIHNDRRTTLYTISPNYKPMKKIDVQPPKPFVRDPDDNSWRNESISSLGIVFKPKNASKSFKEVLKTKTETEFYSLLDNKDSKNEVPDLRLRLEKIAEVRKSKKRKTNKAGEVVYIDYEENNSGEGATSKVESILDTYSSTSPTTETTTQDSDYKTPHEAGDVFKKFEIESLTTDKPKRFFNEYYDSTDEDDDYVTLPNIDLKKYTRPFAMTPPRTTASGLRHHTTDAHTGGSPATPLPVRHSTFPERRPTVDYFPPRTTTPKVNIDQYDDDFQKKVNYYTTKEETKEFVYPTEPVATDRPRKERTRPRPMAFTAHPWTTPAPPRLSSPRGFAPSDASHERGSYVIKHYRDILREAVESSDAAREFGYAEPPRAARHPDDEEAPGKGDYDDYDAKFGKDVLNRFIDNFNRNSERYRIEFPVLYNNSVVHQRYDEEGRVSSSSSSFVKGAYGGRCAPPAPCDVTVELAPAYELHYYVPDQEERELADVPYSFKA